MAKSLIGISSLSELTPSFKMRKVLNPLGFLLSILGLFLLTLSSMGCAAKPNDTELERLDEAKKASEAAEIRLQELKNKRMELEKTLLEKQKSLESQN